MSYKIIEVHATYVNDRVDLVAVLWESNSAGWARATYARRIQSAGYIHILPDDILNDDLIQRIAAGGMELAADWRRKFFPGRRQWDG